MKSKNPAPKPKTPPRPDPSRKDAGYLAKRRKASAMRQSVAHESQARTVVDTMLEDFTYGGGDPDYENRAGGPNDPWRKGGLGKISLGKTKNRPGALPAKAAGTEDEDEEKKAAKPPGLPGKYGDRMGWKPASESVQQALGTPTGLDAGLDASLDAVPDPTLDPALDPDRDPEEADANQLAAGTY